MALKLKGSTSGFVGLDAPSVAGNNTLILPENSGSAFQVFANDITAGVTTFTQITISRNGDLTVPGTISIGGTLTYEDVTSVDSVGIVTARGLSIFGNTTGLNVASGISTFQNITAVSATLSGNISMAGGNINLGDSGGATDDRISIGAGGDLHLYHDGTDSYVSNATGDLRLFSVGSGADDVIIRAKDDIILQPNNGSPGIKVIGTGAIELYHNGSKTFETASGGATVTGVINVAGGTSQSPVQSITSNDFVAKFESSDSTARLVVEDSNSTANYNGLQVVGNSIALICNNETGVQCVQDGSVELYYDNLRKFRTVSDGVEVNAAEGADAVLALIADEGDDNADYWRFLGGTAGQLDIANYATGSWLNNMTINGSGHVTKPRTAMFSARGQDSNWHYFNSGSGWYNLGDASYSGSAYYIDHGWTTSGTGCGVRGVLANGNSVWENDKARFTAPVNGFYFFEISMYIRTFNGGSTFHLQPWIDSSDTNYYTSNIGNIRDSSNNVTGDTQEYPHVHRSITVYLTANQIFRWVVYAQGTDRFQTYKGYAHQSGFLVG